MQDLDRFPTGGREGLAQIARFHSGRATFSPVADDASLPSRAARVPETPGCASPHWLSRPVRLRPFTSSCHGPCAVLSPVNPPVSLDAVGRPRFNLGGRLGSRARRPRTVHR